MLSVEHATNGSSGAPTNDSVHPRWVRETTARPLDRRRLHAAKAAFTTRRIDLRSLFADTEPTLLSGAIRPRAGDLVLARVDRIGHHRKIELTSGRRAGLHLGDEILVVYGDRYATDQFESHVPLKLGRTQLVASGGIASTVLSRSGAVRRATEINALGLVADHLGMPINLSDFTIDRVEPTSERPPSIAVFGTAMNSGKTTTVQSLVRGVRLAGGKPGATKVTGTGSGADYWVMVDAGAHCVADFTDVGLATTFRIPFQTIEANFVHLVNHLTNQGCSEIVIEVADGLFQTETAQLIRSDAFRELVDGVIFAASDAMGALAGSRHLLELDVPLLCVSGLLTRSPLAHREAAEFCDVPVIATPALSDPDTAMMLMKGGDIDLDRLERQVGREFDDDDDADELPPPAPAFDANPLQPLGGLL